MKKVRTTLKIEERLKKAAEIKAIELDVNLQDIFNKALEEYLDKLAEKNAEQTLKFKDKALGASYGTYSRNKIYDWE